MPCRCGALLNGRDEPLTVGGRGGDTGSLVTNRVAPFVLTLHRTLGIAQGVVVPYAARVLDRAALLAGLDRPLLTEPPC